MWESFVTMVGKGGTLVVSALTPFIEPIVELLKKAAGKSYILFIAWMARREGKKDARNESVEETLKDVANDKKIKKNKTLRDLIDDKYGSGEL